MSFQSQSKTLQVAQHLREEIKRGVWPTWLPTERELSERLQVSRGTVRAALVMLARENWIESRHGQGTRVLRSGGGKRSVAERAPLPIGVLAPEPIDQLRPYMTIWIDTLRGMLMERGTSLQLHTGHGFFLPRGSRHLQRLVDQHPSSCWVLLHSNDVVQRWFQAAGVPCVIVGTPHPGIELPHVSLDLRAACRHAAGELWRQGHRRIGFVTHQRPSPGAREAQQGFLEALGSKGREATELIIVPPDEIDTTCRIVWRALQRAPQITGLMVLNPMQYIGIHTYLQSRGMRIPEQISLITTYGDPFLAFVRPSVARYQHTPSAFARKLHRAVTRVVAGEHVADHSMQLAPIYRPGQSMGPAPDALAPVRE